MKTYGIYILTDETGRVAAVNSEGLIEYLTGWIRVGEYRGGAPHAQGNFFPEPLVDERGVLRYACDPGSERGWRERTRAEMDADAARIAAPVSDTDAALVELAALTAALMEGVAELAALIGGGE